MRCLDLLFELFCRCYLCARADILIASPTERVCTQCMICLLLEYYWLHRTDATGAERVQGHQHCIQEHYVMMMCTVDEFNLLFCMMMMCITCCFTWWWCAICLLDIIGCYCEFCMHIAYLLPTIERSCVFEWWYCVLFPILHYLWCGVMCLLLKYNSHTSAYPRSLPIRYDYVMLEDTIWCIDLYTIHW